MPIADLDIKKLWGLAAGRCSRPDCGTDCIKFFDSNGTVLGEMAHMIARQPKGRRGMPGGGSNAYNNLILLCPTHHTEIDKAPEGTFPIELLREWKTAHERRIREMSVVAETDGRIPTGAEVRQLRAYVSIVEGTVAHTIGCAPTASLVLKNTGQTEARNVTWRASFAVAAVDAEIPLDRTCPPATNILAPGGTLFYQYTFTTWKTEWDTLLKSEAIAIIALGEIDYLDVYGNHWPSTYRLINGGAFGRSTGIAPGKFGTAPSASQSKK